MNKRELEKRRRHVRQVIGKLEDFVLSYRDQRYYEDYTDTIILDDMLYGVGLALWGDEHKGPSGYERTIARLREHLATKT